MPLLARTAALGIAAFALFTIASAGCGRLQWMMYPPSLSDARNWWILIGHIPEPDAIDWRRQTEGSDLVVLNADARIPLASLDPRTVRVGYLSVGEADPRRDYWASVSGQPFLIEANPRWDGAPVRVDMRDSRWQDLLIKQEAPRLLALGFQGFMLDTLDTAAYLEGKDPIEFGGSRQALRDILARLRAAFPGAVMLANGAASLADAAPFVDGYVVEGVFATHDDQEGRYRRTTDDERAWKLGAIDRALAIARRPVFAIEYAGPDAFLAQWAKGEALKHGLRPYVGARTLDQLPTR